MIHEHFIKYLNLNLAVPSAERYYLKLTQMEVRKFESDIIDTFTIEAICFLKKLENFYSESNNKISENLIKQFNLILDVIGNVFKNDPDIVKTEADSENESHLRNRKPSFFCTFCSCLVTYSIDAIENHIKLKHSTQNISEPKLVSSIPPLQVPIKLKQQQIPEHFLKYYAYVKSFNELISDVKPITEQISIQLNKHLHSYLLPINVYLHGSRAFGLANHNSNFNFYLEINSTKDLNSTQKVKIISDCLQNYKHVWRTIRENRKARIPSTEIKNLNLSITCKFTFENGLIYQAQVELVNFYFKIPIIRRVASIIRLILNHISINSYILSMLVIFFYQSKSIVPPTSILASKCIPLFHGSWQINFNTDLDQLKSHAQYSVPSPENCFIDYKSFCLYYSNFDFEKYIISPFTGISIEKNKFTLQPFLQYDEYKALTKNSPICIQDPIEQNINLTEHVTKEDVMKFKELLRSHI